MKRADFDLENLLARIRDRIGLSAVLGEVANQAFWIQYASIRDYLVRQCRDTNPNDLVSQICREMYWPMSHTIEELEKLRFIDFASALRQAAIDELDKYEKDRW